MTYKHEGSEGSSPLYIPHCGQLGKSVKLEFGVTDLVSKVNQRADVHPECGIYIHSYEHIFIHIYMYLYLHVYMYIHIYMFIYLHIYILIYVYIFVSAYVHNRVHDGAIMEFVS